jgi:hypothetical protein
MRDVGPVAYARHVAVEEIPPGVRFVWNQAERRLEAQMRQADALDTKAGVLVGLHALTAGLVASVSGSLSVTSRWIAVMAIVGLILSGAMAFMAYRTEAYDRNPSAEDLWRFSEWDGVEIQYRFLSTRLRALRVNSERLRAKARWVSWSLGGLAVVASVVGISAVVGLMRPDEATRPIDRSESGQASCSPASSRRRQGERSGMDIPRTRPKGRP